VWPKLFTLKKTGMVWHSKNTKNCSVNNAFAVQSKMNKQRVVGLCCKFNKAVSIKHLKVENYSIILQKEFIMKNRQRVLQATNTISSNDAKTWTMIQRIQSLNSYAKQNWLPTANKVNEGIVHSVGLLYLMSGCTCSIGA